MARISAVDNAVSAPAIRALRAQIIAAAARPANAAGTHWYALDTRPRLLFEQVIQHLHGIVPRGGAYAGAEWWFRAASTDTGFPFHFDRDEAIRSAVVSPDLATILYLGDAGGPTVILDATPTRIAAPRTGIAVHPRAGRFAMFPGAFLHGVLPGQPGRWPRVTLLVNWWRQEPRMERAVAIRGGARPRRSVGGCMVAAPLEPIAPSRLLARAAWVDLIAKQATDP